LAVNQHLPVTWVASDPFQLGLGDVEIMNGLHPNAARVFVNWLLSREGQAAFVKAVPVTPGHPLLRSQEQYQGIFADAYRGKQAVVVAPGDAQIYLPDINKVWQALWLGS
jgi:ABC-type glycerol-3-phosphate transport system substrate-binding protein